MQKVTGHIFNIVPLVVAGNTIHVFSMQKERTDDGMGWGRDSNIYAAVFVTPQPNGDGQPTDLALQLACMRDEAVVEVTIEDIEGEVPCSWQSDPKRRLNVVALQVLPRPRGV